MDSLPLLGFDQESDDWEDDGRAERECCRGKRRKIAAEEKDFRMKRTIGLWNAVFVSAGVIVGSGIFISPNGVFRAANGSIGVSLLIWVLGGIFAALSALCYCELAASIPESGGDFVYFNFAYGPTVAFLVPWMHNFMPSGMSINVLLFARYAVEPFLGSSACQDASAAIKIVALCLVYFVTWINCTSTKAALRLQIFLTSSKFLAMFVVVCGAVVKVFSDSDVASNNFRNTFDTKALNGLSFVTVTTGFYQVMWYYEGWTILTSVVEEMKDPEKNLGKATIISLFIVIIAYLSVNIAYFFVLNSSDFLTSDVVALTFADKALGQASWLIQLFVCLCAVGSFNASTLSYGRNTYVAARRGHLPQIFGMLHVSRYTPPASLCLDALFITILVLIGNIDSLIEAYGFVNWTFYGLSALSVLVLRRKRPDLSRPYKVPTAIPIIVFIVSVFFVVFQFVFLPNVLYIVALASLFTGVAVFQILVEQKLIEVDTSRVTEFAQKLFQVAPADWNKIS